MDAKAKRFERASERNEGWDYMRIRESIGTANLFFGIGIPVVALLILAAKQILLRLLGV